MDLQIEATCVLCGDIYHQDNLECICDSCVEESQYTIDEIKKAAICAFSKDYIWKDKNGYIPFGSDKEADTFLRGVRFGFYEGVFNMCKYFGDELIEESIIDKHFDKQGDSHAIKEGNI